MKLHWTDATNGHRPKIVESQILPFNSWLISTWDRRWVCLKDNPSYQASPQHIEICLRYRAETGTKTLSECRVTAAADRCRFRVPSMQDALAKAPVITARRLGFPGDKGGDRRAFLFSFVARLYYWKPVCCNLYSFKSTFQRPCKIKLRLTAFHLAEWLHTKEWKLIWKWGS